MINSRAEVKFMGDEYAGFYSCGLSMLNSTTMRDFSEQNIPEQNNSEQNNSKQDISEEKTSTPPKTTAESVETAPQTVAESVETAPKTTAESVETAPQTAAESIDLPSDPSVPSSAPSVHTRIFRNSTGVELKVVSTVIENTEATEIRTSIKNGSDSPVTMELLTSFLLEGIKADKIHRLTSFWSAEGRHRVDTVNDLNLEMSWNHMAFRCEKFGNVGSMPVRRYFPFVVLEDSEKCEFTGVQLYSPSSWQIEITCQHEEFLNLAGGIADRDFGQWTKTLLPGESFEAPKAVVATGRSFEEVCDRLVKSQKPDISPLDNQMGIAFNEYCTTWGNPNEEKIKRIADRLSGKGIQYLVMDSGWYGEEGFNWWDTTGDWRINEKRFPNGLKVVADYIREKGMIPGIWFEPEVVTPYSGLYDRADMLVKKDGVPLTVGGRRFLDMESEQVKSHLDEKVIGLLKQAGFGYIKVDYNDTMGMGCDETSRNDTMGMGCDETLRNDTMGMGGDETARNNNNTGNTPGLLRKDGPGEILRRKVLASQAFFRRMREQLPELVIENCSSGGHRLEPSFMELASQASFSDAHEIVALPLIAANLHRVIRPEQSQIWAVLRKEDSDARISFSMCATLLGRMGLSGDIYDLSDHQWKLVDDGMEFYRNAADIIKDGMTVIIDSDVQSYNRPSGGQLVVRRLGNRMLVIYHRFAASVDFDTYLINRGLCRLSGEQENNRGLCRLFGEQENNRVLNPIELIAEYGCADCDFSAVGRIYKC